MWTMRIAIAVVLVLAAVGCGNIVSDSDALAVRFKNDLGKPVRLALCNSDHSEKCENPAYSDPVPAGGSIEENIAPTVQTEWAVLDDRDRPMRCVVLYWQHDPLDEPVIRLSSSPRWANPCPRRSNT